MSLLLLKTVVLLSVLQPCLSYKSDDCFYYFIGQPSPDTSCNPWPLLTSTSTLLLHCHILAPKNNNLPNIEWYKDCQGTRVRVYPGGSDPKYSNPVSSGDLIDFDFKFVNFSLVIHNISSSDVGCYWCEVSLNGGEECTLNFHPSSQFCLLEESQYMDTSDCHALSLNEDKVCVASRNKMCDPNSKVSRTQSTSIIEVQSVITKTKTVATHPPLPSLTTSSHLAPQNSRPVTNSVMILKSQPVPGLQAISGPAPSQQELRVGLYMGVGVCCLLLVVILVLLAAVAVLCKAPRDKRGKKNSVAAHNGFCRPLNNVVWRRSNTSPMSLVNEGNVDFVSSSSHTSSTHLPSQSAVEANRGWTDESIFEPRTNMGENLNDSGHEHQTLPLINEDAACDHQCHVNAHTRQCSGSPDSHYYHVLEPPPGYYSSTCWLASATTEENQELLSRNCKEAGKTCQTLQHTDVADHDLTRAACIIEGEEKDGYHWRVTPSSSKKGEIVRPRRSKNEYTPLDCTKMKPENEYTQVNVKRSSSIELLEREQ